MTFDAMPVIGVRMLCVSRTLVVVPCHSLRVIRKSLAPATPRGSFSKSRARSKGAADVTADEAYHEQDVAKAVNPFPLFLRPSPFQISPR
jgi:hypothetical protein